MVRENKIVTLSDAIEFAFGIQSCVIVWFSELSSEFCCYYRRKMKFGGSQEVIILKRVPPLVFEINGGDRGIGILYGVG